MNTKFCVITVALMIGAGTVIGYSKSRFHEEEKKHGSSEWKTGVVVRRDMGSSVLATGIVKPCIGSRVRVGSRVSGIVKKLHVRIGDQVAKGEVLAKIDPTELQAKYDQAKAVLENEKAIVEFRAIELKRINSLVKNNVTSRSRGDEAIKNFKVAESAFKRAEADLEYARIQLEYTTIRAPISGVVASVTTQKGETVAANFTAPTFVVIIDLNRLEVRAYVDETDIGRIMPGQGASFTVDTYPDVDFTGRVTAIYPDAEMKDNVVNYLSIIDILDVKGRILRPEMTVTVRIFQETRENVLAVPKHAVKRDGGKKCVTVLNGDRYEKRRVETGFSDDSHIEIIRGLEEGETIITGKKESV